MFIFLDTFVHRSLQLIKSFLGDDRAELFNVSIDISWRDKNIVVMSGNYLFVGVSHMVVNDDFSGVVAIVKWLSYVPKVMVSWGRQHLKFTQNCCIKMFYFVLFVNKFKPSKVCGRQHLKLNDITSNFLKAVFHKFYLVHSWIYCLNYALYECVDDSSSWSTQHLWVAYCPVAVSLLFFLPVLVSNIKTPWIFLLT